MTPQLPVQKTEIKPNPFDHCGRTFGFWSVLNGCDHLVSNVATPKQNSVLDYTNETPPQWFCETILCYMMTGKGPEHRKNQPDVLGIMGAMPSTLRPVRRRTAAVASG
ncbi:MAG: hypothetical protein IPK19_10305 [Chloroflexi bacterium]|nr:hypothetical protein [Chloroflexota bacterium]